VHFTSGFSCERRPSKHQQLGRKGHRVVVFFVRLFQWGDQKVVQLVQRYQPPAFALSRSTDSKVIGQQATAEAALSLMADVLMGGILSMSLVTWNQA